MAEEKNDSGRPMAIDSTAESANVELPAFLARPPGAPVYHGFQTLEDVVVDGFTLGLITAFEEGGVTEGDAFVIAPDDSRAGLVWEFSNKQEIGEICPIVKERWGVWAVSFPFPICVIGKMHDRTCVRFSPYSNPNGRSGDRLTGKIPEERNRSLRGNK